MDNTITHGNKIFEYQVRSEDKQQNTDTHRIDTEDDMFDKQDQDKSPMTLKTPNDLFDYSQESDKFLTSEKPFKEDKLPFE